MQPLKRKWGRSSYQGQPQTPGRRLHKASGNNGTSQTAWVHLTENTSSSKHQTCPVANISVTKRLSLLCYADYGFRCIQVGYFERTSNGRVYAGSDLGRRMENKTLHVPPSTSLPGAAHLGYVPHSMVANEHSLWSPTWWDPTLDRISATKKGFSTTDFLERGWWLRCFWHSGIPVEDFSSQDQPAPLKSGHTCDGCLHPAQFPPRPPKALCLGRTGWCDEL